MRRPRRAEVTERGWWADTALALGHAGVGVAYVVQDDVSFGLLWCTLAIGWSVRAVLDRRRWRAAVRAGAPDGG
ncbi:hypothetical protein [Modestobacter versicolor]|uniref:hypothetical protein n=1 Tax=Modestobacter versicolor TaxID=429133 RepID=UPI0034DE6D49